MKLSFMGRNPAMESENQKRTNDHHTNHFGIDQSVRKKQAPFPQAFLTSVRWSVTMIYIYI